MTKISKQIKLQVIQDYMSGKYTMRGIISRYGIAKSGFRMLIAAYKNFGPDILFNPPAITPEFKIKVASWAIQNNASHSQVAAKFGYTGIAQIVIDRFHIIQLTTRSISAIRRGLQQIIDKQSREYKIMKNGWRLFLKKYGNLETTHRKYKYMRGLNEYITEEEAITLVFKSFPRLEAAYLVYQ